MKCPVFKDGEFIAAIETERDRIRIEGKLYYLHHFLVDGEVKWPHFSNRQSPVSLGEVKKVYVDMEYGTREEAKKVPINRIKRADVLAFRMEAANRINTANTYQTIAGQSAVYPGAGKAKGLMYLALKLNGESGEYAEHLGKAMRDDGFGDGGNYSDLTDDRRLKLKKELGDQLWYIQQSAKELGYTLSEIMIENLEKLCDRGERDVLSGSGDER